MKNTERIVFLAALALMGTAIWIQSVSGRQDVITHQRQDCTSFSGHVLVPLANALRAEQETTSSLGNINKLPLVVQADLLTESGQIRMSLQLIDKRIDKSTIIHLNPTGQYVIKHLGKQAYSCAKAYPDTSVFPRP